MRKVIFRIRELVWWFVAELEDILYPYTDDYDNHAYALRSPEIDDISELRDQLQAAFEKIERLQSEMIHVQNTQRRQVNVSKSK
jgi:TolA-binding protein